MKNKIFTLILLSFIWLSYDLSAQNKVVYIDLGSPNVISGGNWNNLTGFGEDKKIELINADGISTGISAWISDAFTDFNLTGTTSPDPSLGFPSTTTSDSFYGNTAEFVGVIEPTGGVTLLGLDKDTNYSFQLFASRDGVTDIREAQYEVTGATVETAYLDASNNKTNVAEVLNIKPDANGKIVIIASPGPNNNSPLGLYYFGTIKIEYATNPVNAVSSAIDFDTEIKMYPNPLVNGTLIIDIEGNVNDDIDIIISDMQGIQLLNKKVNNAKRVEIETKGKLIRGNYIVSIRTSKAKCNKMLIVE